MRRLYLRCSRLFFTATTTSLAMNMLLTDDLYTFVLSTKINILHSSRNIATLLSNLAGLMSNSPSRLDCVGVASAASRRCIASIRHH